MAADPNPLTGGRTADGLSSAEALRRLAGSRDAAAWEWILHAHGPDILRTTARILDDAALAEDACQETLLQIRDRAGQFRATGPNADASARNWIMRIACNTALHILRRRRRAQHREDVKAYQDQPVSVDLAETEALAKIVRGELAEMPDRQRLPLVLHFFAGLNYEQLSTELRCSAGAARVRVHRALQKLRERLAVLGLACSLAVLYALLESAPAYAAETVLSPERLARWQELLLSSQQAAVNVLSDGNFPALAKVGYAAATAMLCGSLALGFSEKAPPAAPTAPAVPTSRAIPGPAAAADITRIPAAVIPRSADKIVLPAPPSERAGAQKPAPVPEGQEPRTAFNPDKATTLVSPVAQLRLLRMMQHEVNARIAAIYRAADIDAQGGKILTLVQLELLHRAADDQAQISRLLALLAEELRRNGKAELQALTAD